MSKPIIFNITKKQQAKNAALFADATRKGFIAGIFTGNIFSIAAAAVGAKIGQVITENKISQYADLFDEADIDDLSQIVDDVAEKPSGNSSEARQQD